MTADIPRGLPRFSRSRSFHERPDSSYLYLVRQCPYIHTLVRHENTCYQYPIPICVPDDQREDLQQHGAAAGLHGQEPSLSPHSEERDHLEVWDKRLLLKDHYFYFLEVRLAPEPRLVRGVLFVAEKKLEELLRPGEGGLANSWIQMVTHESRITKV